MPCSSKRPLQESLESIPSNIQDNLGQFADSRVETAIREKFSFLAQTPGAGHRRKDLTEADVKFFPVYSYLIVYRPETTPLQIASILHGRRYVEQILKGRL